MGIIRTLMALLICLSIFGNSAAYASMPCCHAMQAASKAAVSDCHKAEQMKSCQHCKDCSTAGFISLPLPAKILMAASDYQQVSVRADRYTSDPPYLPPRTLS